MQQHGKKDFAHRPPSTSPHPPPPLGYGVNRSDFNFFQNMAMLHNKLKGMEHRAQCKHMFSPYTHPQPVGWIKK